MDKPIQIVWFKKDLRLHDHEPLQKAILNSIPTLLIYIFEPSLCKASDCDIRHLRFVFYSLQAMDQILSKFQTQIHIFYAEAEQVFEFLQSSFHIKNVYSHQEIGIQLTFERDKRLAKFFKDKGIVWQEFLSNGVIRGLKNRVHWDKQWEEVMQKSLCNPKLEQLQNVACKVPEQFLLPEHFLNELIIYPKNFQPAGEMYAWRYLKSFFAERANGYTKFISKPQESRWHCSRLSPYLTWGNLSSRQVFQFYLKEVSHSFFAKDLQNFRSRLQWRCHFIQKFESESRMEFEPLNKAYLALEQPINETFLMAWQEGKTGFPLVDACMRAVKATGFLNFRMRAMLVSFLTHLLWQPWWVGVHFLARQFLDYEVGIHFSQFQMQAGVWGTNTIRIYNPIKQSEEHDGQGNFIRQWLPELAKVPNEFIHEPYKMSLLEQKMYDCKIGEAYPLPIINLQEATKHAADILWSWRKRADVKAENERILQIHSRPKKENPTTNK